MPISRIAIDDEIVDIALEISRQGISDDSRQLVKAVETVVGLPRPSLWPQLAIFSLSESQYNVLTYRFHDDENTYGNNNNRTANTPFETVHYLIASQYGKPLISYNSSTESLDSRNSNIPQYLSYSRNHHSREGVIRIAPLDCVLHDLSQETLEQLQKENFYFIFENSEIGIKIIQDSIVSSLENTAIRLKPTPVCLSLQAENALDDLRNSISRNSIPVRLNFGEMTVFNYQTHVSTPFLSPETENQPGKTPARELYISR